MLAIFYKSENGARCQLFGLFVTALLLQKPAIGVGYVPAQLGEFPHMAALGYRTIDEDGIGSYEFLCSGTLIEDRFVLTSAHCTSELSTQPVIVRLGFVDFNNTEEMKNAVDIPIKKIYVHPYFSIIEKINDIAVIELKYPCEFSDYIYPACLNTEIIDPPKNSTLIATSWGFPSMILRQRPNILLKAKLEIVDLATCRAAYLEEDYVLNTGHLCVIDRKFNLPICHSHLGGPLNLLVDAYRPLYSVVGVTSASGFGCSPTGLYTRVANYLDFIEEIVWPK